MQEAGLTGSISLTRFYIRRALRILPIYVTYLLVLALLTAFGLYHDSPSSWLGALTFTRNMIGQGRSATVQLWSLAVEEQFYLLWPILLGFAFLVAASSCIRLAVGAGDRACSDCTGDAVSATPGGRSSTGFSVNSPA